jgi:hypothetical protein
MVIALAFGAGYQYRSRQVPREGRVARLPVYEEKLHREILPPKPLKSIPQPPPVSATVLPRVVIVIDDIGYHKQLAEDFIDLDVPLTFSFLPQSPHAKEMALLAHQKGKETLIHLPMEPKTFPEVDPGPGALLVAMGSEEIQTQVGKDLEGFPHIAGANNHMGSRFTEDREKLAAVFKILKKRKLFFLDSLTTSHSAAPAVGSELGIKVFHRDLFLDNVVEKEAIRLQLERLVQLARTKGFAVGCGHPYPMTLQTLKEQLPRLKGEVQLVTLAQLM